MTTSFCGEISSWEESNRCMFDHLEKNENEVRCGYYDGARNVVVQ